MQLGCRFWSVEPSNMASIIADAKPYHGYYTPTRLHFLCGSLAFSMLSCMFVAKGNCTLLLFYIHVCNVSMYARDKLSKVA